MNNRKVSIVGAGPAGLVAAINLARDGFRVKVYEKNTDAGGRFNGDFQGIENWSTEEDVFSFLNSVGVFLNFKCEPFCCVETYGPNRKPVYIEGRRPLFYLVERGTKEWSLDQGLKRQALAEGVEFQWGINLKTAPSGWVIIGTGPKSADAIAKGMVFKTDHEDVALAFLDNKIAPGGYAYLLVSDHKATFATCLFRDFKNCNQYFENAVDALKTVTNIDIHEPHEFGSFINFLARTSTTQKGRILYVGESAGFQDALWGFGLRYAMLSGYLAAVSIKTGMFYNELCETHLKSQLETAVANRWIFDHLGNWGYKRLIRWFHRNDVIEKLHQQYQPAAFKRLVHKIAMHSYGNRIKNNDCMHENCDCVWCRFCREETENVCHKESDIYIV